MSRRERDARDYHGKRLHSRFDREPSPKKPKRDEKPDVNLAHSSHRNSSVIEATGHEPKQRSIQDDAPLKAPPASTTPVLQNEKKNLERKGDKPTVRTQHSSDNREAPRSRSYYQHDDRGGAGQGGRNFARREADHRKLDDSRERSGGNRVRDDANDQPKKDERSQSRADEKTGTWRHDRFHELEFGAPPLKKRPAFREKKMPSEPQQTGTAPTESDKPDLAASKRGEERGGVHLRALDKPERTFSRAADDRRERRDGFHHRGEAQRNVVDPSRERYAAIGGRGDRFNVRHGARDSNRSGGFEVEKWKHDLFDEANRSPPPKNEDDQIAKVEALLAL